MSKPAALKEATLTAVLHRIRPVTFGSPNQLSPFTIPAVSLWVLSLQTWVKRMQMDWTIPTSVAK